MEEVRPAYGGRCFADIPGAVVRLLTGDGEGGLDPDVLGSNAFRREEFLRKWLEALGASIAGETEAASRDRLTKLDSVRLKRLLEEQDRERTRQQKKWQEEMAKAREDTRSSYE